RAVRDREHAAEDDVEAVARLALAHERRSRRDLLALHSLRELREHLAGKPGEELDARELVLGRGRARQPLLLVALAVGALLLLVRIVVLGVAHRLLLLLPALVRELLLVVGCFRIVVHRISSRSVAVSPIRNEQR